jgi:hypothetical protein
VGIHEHDLEGRTLVQAAGRLALAQAQLHLVLRLTIAALSRASDRTTVHGAHEAGTRDLCSELSSQFRARCKHPNMRTKLRAVLLECERLSDEGERRLCRAWTVAEDSVAEAGGPRLIGEPSAAKGLGRLAAEITALAKVIDNARRHGFLARAAADEIVPAAEASADTAAVIRLPEPQTAKIASEARALTVKRQATVLQPRSSARLAIMVCPNCQTKVVST